MSLPDAHRLTAAGNYAAAADTYARALADDGPARHDPQAWLAYGLVLRALDRDAAAIPALEQALALAPTEAAPRLHLADALRDGGHGTAARGHYDILLNDDTVPAALRAAAHLGLGQWLHGQGDTQAAAAERHYRAALRLAPDLAAAWSQLAALLVEQGQAAAAEAPLRQALALGQNDDGTWITLALARKQTGDRAGAADILRRIVARNPGNADAAFNLARLDLTLGRIKEGWAGYEARWKTSAFPSVRRHFPVPVWRGESLWGRTLLLWAEQGLGDEVLFASVLPDLLRHFTEAALAAGTRVLLECDPRLVPLLARGLPSVTVAGRADPPDARLRADLDAGRIDYQLPLGSLPRFCRPDLGYFAQARPFLRPDPERAAGWRARLDALGPGLKVGVCWTSGLLTAGRRGGYLSFGDLRPLAAVPGVRLVNLQYNRAAVRAAMAETAPDAARIELADWPDLDQMNDLDGVAALMAGLDLVITAPTSVGELAAALGVPVWRLSGSDDWSALGTGVRPWYPTMAVFPPAADGPAGAVAVMARRLRALSV